MSTEKYAIILMRYSRDEDACKYSLIDEAMSLETADLIASLSVGKPEDVISVCDMAYADDVMDFAKSTYVIDEYGKSIKAPALPQAISFDNKTWAEAWYGYKARADFMLYTAAYAGINIRQLVRAACYCVRFTLEYVPESEIIDEIGLAERFADGKCSIVEIRKARSRVVQISDARVFAGKTSYPLYVARAVSSVFDIVLRKDKEEVRHAANNAAFYCAKANGIFYYESHPSFGYEGLTEESNRQIADMAKLVRKSIPLSKVISSVK